MSSFSSSRSRTPGLTSGCSRVHPRSHQLVTLKGPIRRTRWRHGWLQAGSAKQSREPQGVCALWCSRYLQHHKPATLHSMGRKVRKKAKNLIFSMLLSFSKCNNNFARTSCSGSQVERRWSSTALSYPNLLGDNWMLQEMRRMGSNLAKGERVFIMKCRCQDVFLHTAAVAELVHGRVKSAVWDTTLSCFRPKNLPLCENPYPLSWPRWWQDVMTTTAASSLIFHRHLPFLGGAGLVSLFLFIPLLTQLSRAMVSIWQEALHGRTHVYNTSRRNNRLQNVHSD